MGAVGSGLRAVDWSNYKLERFEKNFYVEDKRVSARSDREIEEFRKTKEMRVSVISLKSWQYANWSFVLGSRQPCPPSRYLV